MNKFQKNMLNPIIDQGLESEEQNPDPKQKPEFSLTRVLLAVMIVVIVVLSVLLLRSIEKNISYAKNETIAQNELNSAQEQNRVLESNIDKIKAGIQEAIKLSEKEKTETLEKCEKDLKKSDLRLNSLLTPVSIAKDPTERQISTFESKYYVVEDAECDRDCLKSLKYFEDKNYATDGKHIYINFFDGASSWQANYNKIESIDAKSFKLFVYNENDSHIFKDKNHVYYYGFISYIKNEDDIKIIEDLDPATTRLISPYCLADKDAVYCDSLGKYTEKKIKMKKIEGADPNTFTEESWGLYRDVLNQYKNIADNGVDVQVVE